MDIRIDVSRNHLLQALPFEAKDTLFPSLTLVEVETNVTLMPADENAEFVYFPISGMISLVVDMKDGKAIETAVVGREGGIGLMSAFGPSRAKVRGLTQLPTVTARISAPAFRTLARAHSSIIAMSVSYQQVLLAQATMTAACNGLHPIEARLCRWLLETRDRAESEVIPLTQDFLSQMLGVRRTSVTSVASRLQDLGAINYSRGVITVRDIDTLKKMSCECYETLRLRTVD